MYVYMTKVISLSDEAYEELRKIKGNLSFSKIVIRVIKEKKKENIMDFAGKWENDEAIKISRELSKERSISSRRMR